MLRFCALGTEELGFVLQLGWAQLAKLFASKWIKLVSTSVAVQHMSGHSSRQLLLTTKNLECQAFSQKKKGCLGTSQGPLGFNISGIWIHFGRVLPPDLHISHLCLEKLIISVHLHMAQFFIQQRWQEDQQNQKNTTVKTTESENKNLTCSSLPQSVHREIRKGADQFAHFLLVWTATHQPWDPAPWTARVWIQQSDAWTREAKGLNLSEFCSHKSRLLCPFNSKQWTEMNF